MSIGVFTEFCVVRPVDAEALKTLGVNGGAFTLHKGDVIEFEGEAPQVFSQPVNTSDNSPLAYYVACTRNGKPSLLSIGILTRIDAKGQPLGEFQAKMREKANFAEVYEALKHKKIKGGELKSHEFAVFENGVRTDRVQTRMIPEIEWA